MEIVFILLPITLGIALLGVAAYVWSVRSGQFENLDTHALKPLLDDESGMGKDLKENKRQNQDLKVP